MKNRRNELRQDSLTCSSKDTAEKVKSQPSKWDETFARHVSAEGSVFRIYEELSQLNKEVTNSPTHTRAKDQNGRFSKEDVQMAEEHRGDAGHPQTRRKRTSQHDQMPLVTRTGRPQSKGARLTGSQDPATLALLVGT